ncbi:MAG: hypothetical protein CVT93_06475 [Bacteroidetes bacterium HGW-Bacteroidetes-10]|nr:MAG: hypothetical protein CVT93_06475 [Bacteroidetes bacterium HGW-Bacteroidetes-10]
MKRLSSFFLALFLLLAVTACKKDPPPVLNVSSPNIDVQNSQGTGTVSITANAAWVTTLTGTWFSISPSSGSGDAVITITAQNNLTSSDRSASIIITTGQEGKPNYLRKLVTVRQSASQLSLDVNSITFEKDAGSKIVKVTANTPWSVSIPSESTWLSVNPKTGSSSTDLVFSATANTGSDRTSRVVVSYGDTLRAIDFLQKRAANSAPSITVLSYPSNNSQSISRLTQCRWIASTDADLDNITYTLEVSDNSSFLGTDGKFLKSYNAASEISYTIPELLKENTRYYWRVTASDSYEAKSVSSVFNFVTGTLGGYIEGEFRVALNNSKGTYPNEIIFLGDGYTVADYVDGGKFDTDVQAGMDAFFNVEPYKSYKGYFKIYKVAAYSQDSGVTQLDKNIIKETAFSTVFKGGSSMESDSRKIYEYAAKVPGMEDTYTYDDNSSTFSPPRGKLENVMVILMVNQDRYAGTCWSWSTGQAIAICPVSTSTSAGTNYRNIINHEAGGHGFGRLADEYVTTANKDKTIPEADKTNLITWQKYGLYPNVDLTSDMLTIRWKHFSGREGYSAVGAFEGGYYYTYGVWKPETSSCMVFNEPYYNAPSRENMVKRIIRTAAGVRVNEYVSGILTPIPNDPYSFDTFIANDVQKSRSGAAMLFTKSVNPFTFVPLAPPVMLKVNN